MTPTPKTTVLLGWEVRGGGAVDIPIRNMVVTGQTQEAGKTTTLEALVARAGVAAVAFITKRGESSFAHARRIAPYFREQTDWEFVASVLEASRGEKLKFERAWIIRASKGARTLAEVQANVREALRTAKGLSADVYLTLDAYLDVVVPAIAAVTWAPRLELHAGINVIDLHTMPNELHHLVIKSSIDYVLAHEKNAIVVLPEAWKFVPESRRTPVSLAAEAFIRQGSALRNYLWLDSQDIGGVSKTILRSCPVWLFGVQREANELKRTLANIPRGVQKPTTDQVATLGLGQFIACWREHARRTYVQPAWMADATARAIARGDVDPRRLPADDMLGVAIAGPRPRKGAEVDDQDKAALLRENQQLKDENMALRRRLEALEKGRHDGESKGPVARGRRVAGQDNARDADDVNAPRRDGLRPASGRAATTHARTFTAGESLDNEALYQAIKARLVADAEQDPAVLKLLRRVPELEVQRTRVVITASADDLSGRLAILLHDGYFDEPRGATMTATEMRRRGWDHDYRNIAKACDRLAEQGFFLRENGGYRAVAAMKVRIIDA